jgi:predicted esterase
MARVLSVDTTIHGRVLVEDEHDSVSTVLVGFHGYAQSAEDMLDELREIPGAAARKLVSIQGLHRFYGRRPGAPRGEERVVSGWMTREDRDLAIADNVAYVDRALDLVAPPSDARLVYVGFSQGASMAYRAALMGRRRAWGIVAIGGDIPPELPLMLGERSWPRVLIAAGTFDTWYTGEKVEADRAVLAAQGAVHEILRFDGGHEWTEELRRKVGDWVQ